ncbi:s-ribonuclease binding protein sbp1-related [Anaeramoeba flamelloides]|uniref:S-ribonuclease binding protein sbp1-related n=1 Tax=Anaeramoeba flamelloides TaxID=1746091 RepID=A0AAV7Z8Q2_9EUKA|nr:s-ribonuclease binding protein sbp1-related [Anaeramoeba flamelloides]
MSIKYDALYSFQSKDESELNFCKGDQLTMIKNYQNGWLLCSKNGQVGIVNLDLLQPSIPQYDHSQTKKTIDELSEKLLKVSSIFDQVQTQFGKLTETIKIKKQELQELRSENQKLVQKQQNQFKETKIPICISCQKESSFLVLNCGHLCFCKKCSKFYQKGDLCPICKKRISVIIPIYY